MAFSKQQLQKFARLIQIEIPDDQLEHMGADVVFDWMTELQAIDTTGVDPMFSPARHCAPLRADVVTDGNMRAAVLANDPDTAGVSRGYFAVPKVMDE
ncbi:Asp-tRNA(Asn)/Glu-tRNA(Gln) amidotransferase subunit GatC [bacterium]|nr:Asp-tRNA(Asn)/Glu-tRNA(Gln) amidotransferase subunit GatC [bacterium]